MHSAAPHAAQCVPWPSLGRWAERWVARARNGGAVRRPSVLNDAPHLPHPWRLSAIPRAFVRVILLCLCDMPYAVASICRCDVARLVPRAACLVARWRVAARVERRRRRRCGRRRRDDSTAAPTLGGRGRSRRASSTSPRSLASASPLGGAAGGGIHVAVRWGGGDGCGGSAD